MNTTINAETAIQKAYSSIYRPSIFIVIAICILAFVSVLVAKMSPWIIVLSLPLGLFFGLLYRSIKLPKWKIWAFESVSNVHALHRAATLSKTITSDKSWLSKMEIWSAADKQKWAELQTRFAEPETLQSDSTVPEKTVIHFSKKTNIYYFCLMLCVLGMGLFYILVKKQQITGGIFSVLGLVLTFVYGRQLLNRKPQVILSNDGIETVSMGFVPWSAIQNEAIVSQGAGSQTRYFLSFDHGELREHIEVGFLDVSTTALSELLLLYRFRSQK
jgi:hypothetical protein